MALTARAQSVPSCVQNAVYHVERIRTLFDSTIHSLHHSYFTTVDNGTYNVKEMLKQEDLNEFITAMMKEDQDREIRDHWTVIPRADMPDGAKTILAIWPFKRKVFPDGRVLKHKSRLCTHGGMQPCGENYWETYAPVVN